MQTETDSEALELFDLWMKACKEFDTKVFCLESEGTIGLYKTWNEYMPESEHYCSYRTQAVFHVWNGYKRVYCGLNYQEARGVYQRCLRER